MMIFSCGKEESGNKPSINHEDKVTWATVVKEYPFLDGFPVFDGEVENWQYKELGSMKTLTFFDYKCDLPEDGGQEELHLQRQLWRRQFRLKFLR